MVLLLHKPSLARVFTSHSCARQAATELKVPLVAQFSCFVVHPPMIMAAIWKCLQV